MWLLGVLFAISSAVGDVPYLLPKTSVPNHYELSVRIMPVLTHYIGNLKININVLHETNTIVLHAKNITIEVENVSIQNSAGVIKVSGLTANEENDFLTLELESVISPGNYDLKIQYFIGVFHDKPQGFYSSYYTSENGSKQYLVASHMEPVYARMAFPCYDEPNLKATFNLTIIHPIGYQAVSNMPMLYSVKTKEMVMITKFRETPKMPTYLLALSVSDFVSSKTTQNGKIVRILVSVNDKNYTKFALSVSRLALRHGEEILNVSYSLPKMDGIAVPTYGFAGGMENWGLIVYGNAIILKDEDIPRDGSQACHLICHEIAHQWFGDLVTLDWWDYVWLNEGFANYYGQKIADLIMPSEMFAYQPYAFDLILLRRSEQSITATDNLNRHVSNTSDFMSKFNKMGYDKGCAIIRFMSLVFPNFDTAITQYLKENSFRNAKPSDLLKAISDHTEHDALPTGATVEGIMDNWINYPGFPVINVNITRIGNQRVIELSQERFIANGSKSPEKWWFPVTLTYEEDLDFDNLKPIAWLSEDIDTKTVSIAGGDGWVIANLQQMVYCRVNYDADNWEKLIAYLDGPNVDKLHLLNYIQLVDDVSFLAKAGRVSEKTALDLLSTVKHSKRKLILDAAQNSFITYAELLRDTDAFTKYKKFVSDILGVERSKVVLKEQNLEEDIPKVLDVLEKGLKNRNTMNAFAQRIFSDRETIIAEKIIENIGKRRSIRQQVKTELLADIKQIAALNYEIKKKFVEHNYYDVEHWLNQKY